MHALTNEVLRLACCAVAAGAASIAAFGVARDTLRGSHAVTRRRSWPSASDGPGTAPQSVTEPHSALGGMR